MTQCHPDQVMAWNDLENIFHVNQRNLISMNSFLSTITHWYIARIFYGDGFIENSVTCAFIVHEITVDIRLLRSVVFAEIINQCSFLE